MMVPSTAHSGTWTIQGGAGLKRAPIKLTVKGCRPRGRPAAAWCDDIRRGAERLRSTRGDSPLEYSRTRVRGAGNRRAERPGVHRRVVDGHCEGEPRGDQPLQNVCGRTPDKVDLQGVGAVVAVGNLLAALERWPGELDDQRPGRHRLNRAGFQAHDCRIFETLTGWGGVLVAVQSEPRAADALVTLLSYGGGNAALEPGQVGRCSRSGVIFGNQPDGFRRHTVRMPYGAARLVTARPWPDLQTSYRCHGISRHRCFAVPVEPGTWLTPQYSQAISRCPMSGCHPTGRSGSANPARGPTCRCSLEEAHPPEIPSLEAGYAQTHESVRGVFACHVGDGIGDDCGSHPLWGICRIGSEAVGAQRVNPG